MKKRCNRCSSLAGGRIERGRCINRKACAERVACNPPHTTFHETCRDPERCNCKCEVCR